MNYTTHTLPHSRLEIRAEEPYETLEPLLPKAAQSLSEEINIPGFRKGHIPYEKIRDTAGEHRILEEASRICIRKQYQEIMRELEGKYEFIGSPDIAITKLAKGEPLAYTITLSIIPALELPDYKKIASRIAREKKEIVVEQKEIEDVVKWLRDSRATLITVTRGAHIGDRVEIDFMAKHAGVKLEGGESKNHPLVIGEGTFVPGFEEQLMGLTTNEEKTFSLVVPQNYHDKAIAGKELEFSVAVKLVQERNPPELTDDFARSLGNFENVAGLEQNIREGITQEKEMKERDRICMEIVNVLAKEIQTEIPEVLIKTELEKMRDELMRSITRMGLKWKEYLDHLKKSEEDLKRDWADDAEKRAKIALALREIAKRESISPNTEEIQGAADRWIAQSGLTGEELKKIDKEALSQYALGVVRNEKVFEFLEQVNK